MPDFDQFISDVQTCIDLDQFKKAETLIRNSDTSFSDKSEVNFYLASTLYFQKHYAETLELSSKLFRRGPYNKSWIALHVLALSACEKKEEADQLLASADYEQDAELLCQLAYLEMKAGKDKIAVDFAEKALKADPDHLYSRLYRTYARARFLRLAAASPEEEKFIAHTLRLSPNNATVEGCIAYAYYYMQHYDKADVHFSEALSITPADQWLRQGNNETQQALRDLKKEQRSARFNRAWLTAPSALILIMISLHRLSRKPDYSWMERAKAAESLREEIKARDSLYYFRYTVAAGSRIIFPDTSSQWAEMKIGGKKSIIYVYKYHSLDLMAKGGLKHSQLMVTDPAGNTSLVEADKLLILPPDEQVNPKTLKSWAKTK